MAKGIQLEPEQQTTLDLQHINVKLPLRDAEQFDLGTLIPVFHSWIQDQVCDELLLDVADYRHVPEGPGVVLIGHEADYSVDNTDARLGVRYNRKGLVSGNNQHRLAQAVRSALMASQRLQEDTASNQKLEINSREIDIWINDRLLAPNREETRAAIEPELRIFFDRLFGDAEYSLDFNPDPRRLLSARIRTHQGFSVPQLLQNLGEPQIA